MAHRRRAKQTEPPQVSDLEAHLGFWLRFVSNHVSGRFRRLVEECGVTVSEWVALRSLYSSSAANTGALGDVLGMTKGAVTKIVDRLEAKGLVVRTQDPADRRIQALTLTRAGRAVVPELAALADENDEHFFGHIPAHERCALTELLRDLVTRHGLRRIPTQ